MIQLLTHPLGAFAQNVAPYWARFKEMLGGPKRLAIEDGEPEELEVVDDEEKR